MVRRTPLPITSGYGFEWRFLQDELERLGFASSYAYIAVKDEVRNPHRNLWENQRFKSSAA